VRSIAARALDISDASRGDWHCAERDGARVVHVIRWVIRPICGVMMARHFIDRINA